MEDDVELLQNLVSHGGTQTFSIIPLALRKVITERQWEKRQDKEGRLFTSFEAFATHKLWQGLETSIEDLLTYCRKDKKATELIRREIEPGREHRRPTKDEQQNKGNNVTFIRGNSALYRLKRLKRERPDLYQLVLGNALSVNKAAIQAGWGPKKLSAFEQIQKLLPKLSPEERRQLLVRLRDAASDHSNDT